jgi:hypothetical protein
MRGEYTFQNGHTRNVEICTHEDEPENRNQSIAAVGVYANTGDIVRHNKTEGGPI